MGYAYLENYQEIKVITENFKKNSIVSIKNLEINLTLINKYNEGKFTHLIYTTDQELKTNLDYTILVDNEEIPLFLGRITRSSKFEELNYYDGPLGFEYHKRYTIFRIWSPVCKEVKIVFPTLNQIYDLTYIDKGLWEVKVNKKLDNIAYYYLVRINDAFVRTLDPYGISDSLKEQVNYVIDIKKTYQFKYKRPSFSGILNDAIILEAHLKDLTYNLEGNESVFQKAIKKDQYGLNYLKDLGITHLQILPVNSFYGIDEEQKDQYYNWGYNPLEYMTLTGWYATKPNDAYNKINEFKKFIDVYHQNNICINLDVVFNHVYQHNLFSYGKLVPGYCFRCDQIGFMTNGSYCGNDLATEHKMIRRLIIDTCKFFTDFYHIDGFRFDLMGLIDITTMKQLEEEVKKLNNQAILYGEGWYMNTGLNPQELSSNKEKLPTIGYFSDTFRDYLRGNPFKLDKCLLTGTPINKTKLLNIIKGNNFPHQSINYLECHDNYTLNDQMEKVTKFTFEQKKDYLKLGLALIILSQGIPFLHLGMEFGRTKQGIDNSYKSNISINQVSWEKTKDYLDVIAYLKKLIQIRKDHEVFRQFNQNIIEEEYQLINNKENYLLYKVHEFEVLVTNTYEEYNYNDQIINKPGLYLFKNKTLI